MARERRRLEAIVFDMDGTLIDSSRAIPRAYIATVRELGGPDLAPDEVVAAYSVGPPRALLSHFLRRKLGTAEVDRYHGVLREHAPGVTVYPGVEETLIALRSSIPLGVFTGASRRACEMLLAATGLLAHFEAVVGGDEVDRPKPQPDGIDLVCSRIGVAPDAAAYVGDAPNDLEAARRSGAAAIAAAWGHQYVPGEPADEVIETPGELLRLLA